MAVIPGRASGSAPKRSPMARTRNLDVSGKQANFEIPGSRPWRAPE